MKKPEIGTNSSWRWKIDEAVTIGKSPPWDPSLGPLMLSIEEEVDGSRRDWDWVETGFDDSKWLPAVKSTMKAPMMPILDQRRLTERQIPLLPETFARFLETVKSDADTPSIEAWNQLIQHDRPVKLEAGRKATVVFAAETYTTGFLNIHMRQGAGAKIRIRCAECFEQPSATPNPFARSKSNRSDSSGILMGKDDYYTVGPDTPIDTTIVYEPFWFRTFRYVELEIETSASAALELLEFTFRETHYPLERTTQFNKFATDEESKMWDISINTLRNCMHETYEDCPFYEQNQFGMDSRLQILFTYQLSNDDRLARKCMQEFHASRRDDGLLETHFPSPVPGVNIPYFSLYWILMVYDHMMYFGDEKLIRRYLGTIDGILDHFHQRMDERNLVGRMAWDAWPFVDWTQQWSDPGPDHDFRNMAVPPAYARTGVTTYSSVIYSLTLQRAARICEFVRRDDTADEYRKRADQLNAAVMKHCFRGGVLVDGPDNPLEERSQHAQVFAVLCGALAGETARMVLRRALTDSSFVRCSYAMSFYVFEAVREVGLYDELRPLLLEPWRNMLQQNLSTWAESAAMPRSDCHAWSAVPIYDFVANVVGMSPATPGFTKIRLEPRRTVWKEMKGEFAAGNKGSVSVEWAPGKKVDVVTDFDTAFWVCVGEGSFMLYPAKKGEMLSFDI
jgi:hypothetical protein